MMKAPNWWRQPVQEACHAARDRDTLHSACDKIELALIKDKDRCKYCKTMYTKQAAEINGQNNIYHISYLIMEQNPSIQLPVHIDQATQTASSTLDQMWMIKDSQCPLI
jgi:hypothetical protein